MEDQRETRGSSEIARTLGAAARPAAAFFGRRSNAAAVFVFVLVLTRTAWRLRQKDRAVRRLLNDFDSDRSDRLSPPELQRLLEQNGIGLSVSQISALFGKVDDEHDGFDMDELASIVSFISDVPTASQQLRDLKDTSWFWDGFILVLTGCVLYYLRSKVVFLNSKLALGNLQRAVTNTVLQNHLGKMKAKVEEYNSKHEHLSKILQDKEMRGDMTGVSGLKTQMKAIAEQRKQVVNDLQREVLEYKDQAEKSMKLAHSIKVCIKGVESFRGAGDNRMTAMAPKGFSVTPVGFATDVITFGTVEDGKLLMFETSVRQKLGEGRDCPYLATEIETGNKYTLKKYGISNPEQCKSATTDLLLKKAQVGEHVNIMKYERVIESAETVFVLMEFISGRSLFETIMDTTSGIPEKEAKTLFRGLTSAVEHLHKNSFFHLDINPQNAMVEEATGRLKLIDFGSSFFLQRQSTPWEDFYSSMASYSSTDLYTPPECSACGSPPELSPAADSWRLGCILFVMLTKATPFVYDNVNRREGYEERMAKSGPFSSEHLSWLGLSTEARDLISKLIVGDPSKRLVTEQVMAHPWLTQ